MSKKTWIPDEIPLDKPNVARIYDYWLGGYHNFEIDRAMGEKVVEIYPDVRLAARSNRAFLRRAVEFCLAQGIDQFLDVGSGLPTVGNVHEIAQAANPAAHVVYVDIDPVAVMHSRAILKDNPNATAIQADARQMDQIINHAEVRGLLDFGRPVAALLVALLHAIPEDEGAYGAVRTLRDALAPGSYMVISHSTLEGVPEEIKRLQKLFAHSGSPTNLRSFAEIRRFFDGLELVEPGLVYYPLWRPEGPDDDLLDCPERCTASAGVGRKP
jgi:hypothetical protein